MAFTTRLLENFALIATFVSYAGQTVLVVWSPEATDIGYFLTAE